MQLTEEEIEFLIKSGWTLIEGKPYNEFTPPWRNDNIYGGSVAFLIAWTTVRNYLGYKEIMQLVNNGVIIYENGRYIIR